MMEDVGDAFQDPNCFIGYFRADAIARQDGEFEKHWGSILLWKWCALFRNSEAMRETSLLRNRSGNAPDPSLRLKDSSARDDASRNWQDSQVFPDTPVFLNAPQIVFMLTVMFGNGGQGQCRAVQIGSRGRDRFLKVSRVLSNGCRGCCWRMCFDVSWRNTMPRAACLTDQFM